MNLVTKKQTYRAGTFSENETGKFSIEKKACRHITCVVKVQCLARKIWRNLLKSRRPTKILEVTSLGSGVQKGFKRMNLKK
jgi:hypothetical protein